MILSKKLEEKVGDISYDFYHGDINVSVNGDFSGLSIYCSNHGYMGGENLLKYSDTCHLTTTTIHFLIGGERNYFINYNNDKRPWKINTSYISHNNSNYKNESLIQQGDDTNYNFRIDSSKNNLRIESVDSNIDLFTYNTNSINLEGKTNFNNNSIFNKSVILKKVLFQKKLLQLQNLVADDISTNTIRLSNTQTVNFIGDLKISGRILTSSGAVDSEGNALLENLLDNYDIENSLLKDSNVNDSIINNSSIGLTNPSQAIFTDVSINNLAIENDLIINNNLKLKNIEEVGYIYSTLISNDDIVVYTTF